MTAKINNTFRPAVESLEGRELMAAHFTAQLSNLGTLSVQGTDTNNQIYITTEGKSIHVVMEGSEYKQYFFDTSKVQRVIVDMGAGNDQLRLSVPVGGIVFGGNGNDYIVNEGASALVQVGNGNDTIFAGPGRDTIFAGNGNDVINGMGKTSQIFAGSHAKVTGRALTVQALPDDALAWARSTLQGIGQAVTDAAVNTAAAVKNSWDGFWAPKDTTHQGEPVLASPLTLRPDVIMVDACMADMAMRPCQDIAGTLAYDGLISKGKLATDTVAGIISNNGATVVDQITNKLMSTPGLLSNNGAGLLSNNGAGLRVVVAQLLSNNGAGLISEDTSGLAQQVANGLVAQGLIGKGSGTLVASTIAPIISNNGATLVSAIGQGLANVNAIQRNQIGDVEGDIMAMYHMSGGSGGGSGSKGGSGSGSGTVDQPDGGTQSGGTKRHF